MGSGQRSKVKDYVGGIEGLQVIVYNLKWKPVEEYLSNQVVYFKVTSLLLLPMIQLLLFFFCFLFVSYVNERWQAMWELS